MELDYENDVRIDEQGLDVEWLRQAELMAKYTKHSAAMKRELDDAKEALDVGKARIEKDIRTAPEEYGLAKITENAVQSTILLDGEYQKLSKAFIEAKYEFEIAVGAVRAIDQKKTALENLVKLHGQSYFAGPSVPRDITKERGAKDAKVRINQQPVQRRK